MAEEKQDKNTEAEKAKTEAPKAEGSPPEAAVKPKAASAGGSPWLPVLMVIIVLPILSFVVTETVMIPRLKRTLGDIAKVQQQSDQPAHGGPLPSPKKAGEKKAEGAHGGGEKAEGGSGSVEFPNVVANLAGSMKSRFLKVSFIVEGDEPAFKEEIEQSRTKIIDSALGIMSALSVADLEEPGIKNIIRSDLIDGFNQVLGKTLVMRLYFSEFVVQ